jgi:hypothetical protein
MATVNSLIIDDIRTLAARLGPLASVECVVVDSNTLLCARKKQNGYMKPTVPVDDSSLLTARFYNHVDHLSPSIQNEALVACCVHDIDY